MGKKNNQKKTRKATARAARRVADHLPQATESKTAIAATVAWMLSLMATVTAEVIGLICRYYSVLVAPSDLMTVMSSVMLFVALISGITTLGLIPVVLRVANTRPPQMILQIAMVAGCLPVAVVALQYVWQ